MKKKFMKSMVVAIATVAVITGCNVTNNVTKDDLDKNDTKESTENKDFKTEDAKADKVQEESPSEENLHNKSVRDKVNTDGTKYSVSKVSEFTSENNLDYDSSEKVLLKNNSNETYTVYDLNGKVVGNYQGIYEIINGYYMLYDYTDDENEANCKGLLNQNGKVLIDCNTAGITKLQDNKTTQTEYSDRYLNVFYSEGVTDDVNECYFYSSSGISLGSPSKTDIMYTGYSMVYDVYKNRFVPDIKFTKDNSSNYGVTGDYIYNYDGKKTSFYDEDGKLVYETNNSVSAMNCGYIIENNNNEFVVYDLKNIDNEIYKSTNILYCISGNGIYLKENIDGKYKISDIHGNYISDSYFSNVTYESNGNFVVQESDTDKYGVVDNSGNIILDFSDESISKIDNGYYYRRNKDAFDVVDNAGVAYENLKSNKSLYNSLIFDETDDNLYNVFIFKDDKYNKKFSSINSITDYAGLCICSEEINGDVGLYDVLSGTLLLDCKYDKIQTVGTYIYAQKDNHYEVYSVDMQ